jgi:hypothetical protein
MSGVVLAGLSAAALHVAGFGALSGIATIVACLTLNQLAYFAGLLSRSPQRRRAPGGYRCSYGSDQAYAVAVSADRSTS